MQTGIFLAFEPIFDKDGETYAYYIQLINNTMWKIVFDGSMYIGDDHFPLSGSVESQTADELDTLPKQDLNDYPSFELTIWRWTTAGQDGRVNKNLKIKPKQFFKKIADAPILNTMAHVYKIADDFAPPIRRSDTLKAYTETHLPDEQSDDVYEQIKVKLHDVKARAKFPESIDLHIYNLTDEYKKMDAVASLALQLKSFENYIDEAVLIGVPFVYIVHGKGKGRLREEIHRRLKDHQDVVRFESGFHEGYGAGGATKVFF